VRPSSSVGLTAREKTAARDLTTTISSGSNGARAGDPSPDLAARRGHGRAQSSRDRQAVALVGKLSQRGLTIVIVEHVMRAIMAVARHIVVLDHGQKITEGTPRRSWKTEVVALSRLLCAPTDQRERPSAQTKRRERQLRHGPAVQMSAIGSVKAKRGPFGANGRRQEHHVAG